MPIGDPTLSALEIWGAEYQENDCFLTSKEDLPMVLKFAERENVPMAAVGEVRRYRGCRGLWVVQDGRACTAPLWVTHSRRDQQTY